MSDVIKKIVDIDFKDTKYKNSMLNRIFPIFRNNAIDIPEDNYKLTIKLRINMSDNKYILCLSYGGSLLDHYLYTSFLSRENLRIFNALTEVLDDNLNRTVKFYNNDFERDDINRILYISIINDNMGRIYPKEFCDCIYSKFLEDPSKIPVIENENRLLNIPEVYFVPDYDPSDEYDGNYSCSLMELQLLEDEGLLKEGLLDQRLSAYRNVLPEEKSYCDWLRDKIDTKPIFDYPLEIIEQKKSLFKRIFDKSKDTDLELEF